MARAALTSVTATRNVNALACGPTSARLTAPSSQICAPVSTGYSSGDSRYGSAPLATSRPVQNGTTSL